MANSLPTDVQHLVADMVASGQYKSEMDVIREALELLQQRDQLKRDVHEAIAELDRGEGIDADKVFGELPANASHAPKRRWFRWSLRTMFVVVALAAALPWLTVNLNWMHERHVAVSRKIPHPLEGEKQAPWPLWIFGARGFARIHVTVPPQDVAAFQEAVRDQRLHWQRLFPEAEAVVSSNAE